MIERLHIWFWCMFEALFLVKCIRILRYKSCRTENGYQRRPKFVWMQGWWNGDLFVQFLFLFQGLKRSLFLPTFNCFHLFDVQEFPQVPGDGWIQQTVDGTFQCPCPFQPLCSSRIRDCVIEQVCLRFQLGRLFWARSLQCLRLDISETNAMTFPFSPVRHSSLTSTGSTSPVWVLPVKLIPLICLVSANPFRTDAFSAILQSMVAVPGIRSLIISPEADQV